MTIQELLAGAAALLTIIQITPIKLNPWGWLAKQVGKAINADVLAELAKVSAAQAETRERLDSHIKAGDESRADGCRQRILRFNDELIRDMRHTEEHFNEILQDIDRYRRYCREHLDYPNSRAEHAIANINRVYAELLERRDFA